MARLRYQLLAVFACCTLIAVAYLPPQDSPSQWSVPRRIHIDSIVVEPEANVELWQTAASLRQVSSRLRSTRRYLSILVRRDSVLASLPTTVTSRAGLHVVAASDVPTQALDRIRSFATDLTGDLPIDPQAPPIALALVLDTLPAHPTRVVHAAPTRASNVCLTTVLLGSLSLRELERPSVRPEQIVRTGAQRLLGMCAYFARFGSPGTHVANWLRQSRFAPAVFAEWLLRPEDRAPGRVRNDIVFAGYSWRLSPDRVRCAAGKLDACSAIVAGDEPWPHTLYDPGAPSDVVIGDRSWEYTWHALGANVVRYLSDLVIAMGEDRFQRFWSSELQLGEAFAEAFGVTIGEWTMHWSRDQIGIPRTGPSAPADVAMMSLLVAVVFVGGGVAYSAWRQVG